MFTYKKLNKKLSVVLGYLLFLGGCHIGYPFQGPGFDSQSGAMSDVKESQVLLAITYGEIEAGGKGVFSRSLSSVRARLQSQQGLVGYSVRKEIFGNKVWTMSVWRSEEALEVFLDGDAHRNAVARGGILPTNVDVVYQWISVEELPLSWEAAFLLLENEN